MIAPRDRVAEVVRHHAFYLEADGSTPTCHCGWQPEGERGAWFSDHAFHVRDALLAVGVFREVDYEDLRGKLDQLWGWAKAGKQRDPDDAEAFTYYLMDAENVDSFTRHVLALIGDDTKTNDKPMED